jgi:hypothetical protein
MDKMEEINILFDWWYSQLNLASEEKDMLKANFSYFKNYVGCFLSIKNFNHKAFDKNDAPEFYVVFDLDGNKNSNMHQLFGATSILFSAERQALEYILEKNVPSLWYSFDKKRKRFFYYCNILGAYTVSRKMGTDIYICDLGHWHQQHQNYCVKLDGSVVVANNEISSEK